MATIGVLVPPFTGHLNPMLALGRELATRGHRVVVAGFEDVEAAVLVSGLGFSAIGRAEFPAGSVSRFLADLGSRGRLRVAVLEAKFHRDSASVILREAPGALSAAGADLVLVDQISFGGGSVAEHLGLPYVSVANALIFNREDGVPPHWSTWRHASTLPARLRNRAGYALADLFRTRFDRALDSGRRRLGLGPIREFRDEFSPWAQVSQQPPGFEFPRIELPANFHFCGPFIDPVARCQVAFPTDRLDGRPLIYASLGTIQNRRAGIYRAIAEACDGLGAQLVLSLGGWEGVEAIGPLPGSPIVVRYAPQLQLLARAGMAITHAGLNTTLEALAWGVPLVAVPLAYEQPGVAARIERCGAGLAVPPGGLTASRLRAAVRRVLTEKSFRDGAARMRDAIARSRGAVEAADVIESVLRDARASSPADQFAPARIADGGFAVGIDQPPTTPVGQP